MSDWEAAEAEVADAVAVAGGAGGEDLGVEAFDGREVLVQEWRHDYVVDSSVPVKEAPMAEASAAVAAIAAVAIGEEGVAGVAGGGGSRHIGDLGAQYRAARELRLASPRKATTVSFAGDAGGGGNVVQRAIPMHRGSAASLAAPLALPAAAAVAVPPERRIVIKEPVRKYGRVDKYKLVPPGPTVLAKGMLVGCCLWCDDPSGRQRVADELLAPLLASLRTSVGVKMTQKQYAGESALRLFCGFHRSLSHSFRNAQRMTHSARTGVCGACLFLAYFGEMDAFHFWKVNTCQPAHVGHARICPELAAVVLDDAAKEAIVEKAVDFQVPPASLRLEYLVQQNVMLPNSQLLRIVNAARAPADNVPKTMVFKRLLEERNVRHIVHETPTLEGISISSIGFVTPSTTEFCRRFRRVPLLMDVSEKCAEGDYSLLNVVSFDGNNRNVLLCRVFITNQKTVTFKWIAERALPYLLGDEFCRVVPMLLMDGDAQMQSAFRGAAPFAGAKMRECIWHAITLPLSRLSSSPVASEVALVEKSLMRLSKARVRDKTVKATLESLITRLSANVATAALAQFVEIVCSRSERYFAAYFRGIPHFGQRTTSRVESENRVTKLHQLTNGKVNAGK